MLLGACAVLTFLSTFFAVKYYRAARYASPGRVHDLEQELDDLRASFKALEAKSPAAAGGAVPVPAAAESPSPAAIPLAAPPALSAPAVLFGALPFPKAPHAIPDRKSLPFSLTTPEASWRGNTLRVQFAIQYTKGDGGHQQGRIVILARGPETVLAYPDGVLNPIRSESLVEPERGEYFSVSRYRAVEAEFGPIGGRGLHGVEILILNQTGQLLWLEHFNPPAKGAPEQASPAGGES
jgi:hypothetical protein